MSHRTIVPVSCAIPSAGKMTCVAIYGLQLASVANEPNNLDSRMGRFIGPWWMFRYPDSIFKVHFRGAFLKPVIGFSDPLSIQLDSHFACSVAIVFHA